MIFTISVCILLAVLCLVLMGMIISQNRGIQKIIQTFTDVEKGYGNQRFRVRSSSSNLSLLSSKLNRFMENYQAVSEQGQHLERMSKQMISNISHDLRTPLSSLLGYAEALKNNHDLSERQKEDYLTIISKRGTELSVLINDFFELVKLEEEEEIPHNETIVLNELLKEEVLKFYHAFTEAGIEPQINIPDEPVSIQGEAQSVRRILSNLLSNVLRYGREGGKAGVDLWKEEGKAWITVWDEGRGIKKEALSYIFERFYTGEQSRNPSLQGSGLGLTIAKRLVEKHRGEISVESQPFVRTAFTFYIPAKS